MPHKMARLRYLNCRLLLFVCLLNTVVIVIATRVSPLEENESPSAEELLFMKKYGYLPEDESGDLDYAYTSLSITEPVKKMQEFAGIPITGFLDNTTRKLFHSRRCGIRDIERASRQKRFVTKKGWNKHRITYKILNGTSALSKHRIEELMKKAFDVWAPYGQLQFVKENDSKADIEVVFTRGDHGDRNSFDGPGNIVAHAFGPPHGGMHFDDDETWGENGSGEEEEITDFYAVAVHEIGHALGLGHSSVRSSIMYPYYRVPASGLNTDDITAMYQLYLKPSSSDSAGELESGEGFAPKATVATGPEETPPNICNTDYSTIAVIKYQIFVFKEKWLWIFRDQKLVDEVYPILYRDFFKDLPSDVNIEAIYERKDGNIAIFSGYTYWLTNSKYQYITTGPISDYFLPSQVSNLTAVFRSNFNNKTYFFQSERFYRFNEDTWTMDAGYPKSMSAWREIPAGVNSVVVWKGDTYFFKGPRFWRFDNKRIVAHENYPVPTAQVWFGCPEGPHMLQYLTYP